MSDNVIELVVPFEMTQKKDGVEEQIKVTELKMKKMRIKDIEGFPADRQKIGHIMDVVRKMVVGIPRKYIDDLDPQNMRPIGGWFATQMGESPETYLD